ncbi:aminoglycoside phosphotransferase family protein [Celeribacter sp.]|uniref:aminoglycoside phosphotransferase family protein n=1 Tax=Celeribacter sp. TaxID=1890673 RepID=UPI003A93F1FF
MEERFEQLTAFLSRTEWRDADIEPLAGDASRRRYFRLFDKAKDRHAIVMDAPRALGEDVRPFLKVGAYLRSLGLSAPETYEADIDLGFLVIEDFGDAVFDRICASDASQEHVLYAEATDVLVHLYQSSPLPDVKPYDPQMADLAAASVRWYVGGISDETDEALTADMSNALESLIASFSPARTTILRDYHAQNLVWLPKRDGIHRVGLLDYQDAMSGPAAYDLMSLVRDARRDVSKEVRDTCIARFIERSGVDGEAFSRDCATASAQRNLRILRNFARMSLHFEKPHYVDLIPRVWDHLMEDLEHPALKDIRAIVAAVYPAPTAQNLEILKSKCGTVPTL